MPTKIKSLEEVEAQNPRPARRIRQTHPANQIRLVAVEKAAADLAEAVREAAPAKEEAVALLMAEVMEAAVRAEVKARRAEVKAGRVAVVAKEVVEEAVVTEKARRVATAMRAAREDDPTPSIMGNEEIDDGEEAETNDWLEGIRRAPEDE